MPTITSGIKEVIEKLCKKNPNIFYRLFIDELNVNPVVISNDLYNKLNLDKLSDIGLIWKKEKENVVLCHGTGQFFTIKVRDKTIFMFTDWSNPDIKIIADETLGNQISTSQKSFVFPTFKFKERFYYHLFYSVIEIESILKTKGEGKIHILDFSTGTGAYLLYLATYFNNDKIKFYGTEINKRALWFCKFNIKLNGLEDRIKVASIDILNSSERIGNELGVDKFDIIIANLPYVPILKETKEEYPIWERAGEDGLAVTSKIIENAERLLKENGILLMMTYSLGNKELPLDIFTKIKEISTESLTFFVSHIYPPVWVGFRHQTLHWEGRVYLHHLFIKGKKLVKNKNIGRNYFFFRRLKPIDLPQMIECEEKTWPPYLRASFEKLTKRLDIYPEGVWGAFVVEGNNAQLKLVGFGTSQIVKYYPSKQGKSWTEMTMSGDISKTHNPKGNTLHLVSASVIPKFRRYGIWRNLIILRMLQAYLKKLKFVILHSRIPSFHRSKKDVKVYASKHRYIKFLSNLGFKIGNIIENCENDPESKNYCILMYREIEYEG